MVVGRLNMTKLITRLCCASAIVMILYVATVVHVCILSVTMCRCLDFRDAYFKKKLDISPATLRDLKHCQHDYMNDTGLNIS